MVCNQGRKLTRVMATSSEFFEAVMVRRSVIAGLAGFLGLGAAKVAAPRPAFPPVPSWEPSFKQPRERIIDRLNYYADGKRDFVVFRHGTCVVLDDGLSDEGAKAFALKVLSDILRQHPDMIPSPMDDGNMMVRYNHPAVNIVLKDVAEANWSEIEQQHLEGLTPSEVLITPLGPNQFDTDGKIALLGRAYMFLDARDPEVAEIERHR